MNPRSAFYGFGYTGMGARLDTRQKRSHKGFSLVEMIAGLAVIAVLALIIFLGFNRVMTSACAVECMSHQRQLITAYLLRITDDQGRFPPSRLQHQPDPNTPPGEAARPGSQKVPGGFLHNMLANYIPNPLVGFGGTASNLPYPEFAAPYWCPGRDPSQTSLTTPGTASPIHSYGHNCNLGSDRANPLYENYDARFALMSAVANPSDIIVFADHTAPGLASASYMLENSWPLPESSPPNPGPTGKRIDMERHGGAAIAAFLDGSVRRLTYQDIAGTGEKHMVPMGY